MSIMNLYSGGERSSRTIAFAIDFSIISTLIALAFRIRYADIMTSRGQGIMPSLAQPNAVAIERGCAVCAETGEEETTVTALNRKRSRPSCR